jgi:hypothetical protein
MTRPTIQAEPRNLAAAATTERGAQLSRRFFTPGGEEKPQLAVCQNLVPLVNLVNIKIAGKWMFIPLKMVLIGIDP